MVQSEHHSEKTSAIVKSEEYYESFDMGSLIKQN